MSSVVIVIDSDDKIVIDSDDEIVIDSDEEEADDEETFYADVLAFVFLLSHRQNDQWIDFLEKLLSKLVKTQPGLGIEGLLRSAREKKSMHFRNALYPPRQKKNGGFLEDGFLVKLKKVLFDHEWLDKRQNKKIQKRAKSTIREFAEGDEQLLVAAETDVDIETETSDEDDGLQV